MQSSVSKTTSDDEEDNDHVDKVDDTDKNKMKSKPCPLSRKPKNYSAPTFDDDKHSNDNANVGDTGDTGDGDGQHSSDEEDIVSKSNAISAIANNSQAVADNNVKSEDKNDGDESDISDNCDEFNSAHERVRTPAERKFHESPKPPKTSRRGRPVVPKKAQGKGGRNSSNKAEDGPPARTPKPRGAKEQIKKRGYKVDEDVDPPNKRKRVSRK